MTNLSFSRGGPQWTPTLGGAYDGPFFFKRWTSIFQKEEMYLGLQPREKEEMYQGQKPREVLTICLSFSRGGLLFQKEEMHQSLTRLNPTLVLLYDECYVTDGWIIYC